MASEDLLVKSTFTIFAGFLTFIGTILNQTYHMIKLLDDYFVLFMFCGIFISIIGFLMITHWNISTKKPYFEPDANHQKFFKFLATGALFLFLSFSLLNYYHNIKLIAISLSVIGIIFLVIGLGYFLKEIIQKNPARS